MHLIVNWLALLAFMPRYQVQAMQTVKYAMTCTSILIYTILLFISFGLS
jgi:hypothetical protein